MSGKIVPLATAAVLQRMEALRRQTPTGPGRDDLLSQTLAELQLALEKLQVIEAELRAQNEELAATRELVDRERRQYQDLFEFAPDGYLVTTTDGRIRQANRAALALFNVSDEFVVGKPLAVWIALSDRRRFRSQLARLQQAGGRQPEAWELRLVPWRGEPIDAALTVAPVRDSAGQMVGLRWQIRDVSEQKHAQEQVRRLNEELEQRVRERIAQLEVANQAKEELLHAAEAERRLLAVLKQIPEGVIIADAPDGRLALWNDAAERLRGRSLAGRTLEEEWRSTRPLHPGGMPYALEELPLARALRGETVLGAELVYASPERSPILLASAAPIIDENGRITAAVVVFQDITQRKTLEQLKDEFLSLAAHEIRTPLTAIKGGAQMMLRHLDRGQPLGEWEAEVIRGIVGRVDDVTGLVNELLDLTRIVVGRLDLHREPMDLAAVLRDVVTLQGKLHPGYVIGLEGAEQPVSGTWDRRRREQVFLNLLDNAVKYSPAGRAITVRLRPEGNQAHVVVQDQGIGVPRADLPHLFERHFRASNVGRSPSGLGLGLYLARQIVERHGGSIWAESVEGEGATFHVALPLTVASQTA